ncbi:phage tail protein, partial [Klebsiella pneumoniae]
MEQFKKRKLPEIIAGAGGKKSSGSSRTPVEADDTVNSNVKVSILDLLGEGVIGGLKYGAKSIFLNDLPLQNSDDTYNHSGVTWWFRDGSQDQSIIEGFDYTETPKTIGLQVKKTSAVTMAVDSDSADRFRVILKFPSLKSVDKKTGDTSGTSVTYKFQVSSAGGAFVDVAPEGESSGTVTLTAKKAGVYYRSYMLNLPKPGSKYQVRVVRVTDDNKDTTYLANDIYVDTVGEIINTNMNYPNSALVGLSVNSAQFGSSMPSRSYLISGMKIRVPSNYDEVTNEYRGTWDGSFKLLSSSNPAWILYDLVTNKRYGLGEFVRESMFDLGQLYQIGRYCDALVDDGFGGKEKRFAINTQITTLQDAYRCVQDIAGAFRGMVYWAGGMVHVTQDSPSDPIAIYSNSNVIDGRFSYKGSARKDRPSVALITYNNKEDNYKQNIEYVEDLEAIKRYGIRKTESVAFGCTSRGMAHRVGLWTLYTGRMESDVITFQTGMDSAFLVPGDVILIHDKFRAGRRNSGRVVASTANSITLDSTVDMTKAGTITFINAEGRMISRDILESGVVSKVTFKDAVNEADRPVADGIWVISQSDLKPLQARVVGVTQGEDGVGSTITCIQNNPSKYAAIDDGAVLIPQNTTVLDPTFSKPENLKITEGTYLSSPGNLNVSLTATWEGKSAEYWVSWRRSDAGNVSNWQTAKVNEEQFEVKPVAESGKYDFQVYGVSVSGRKTEILSTTYQVLGTMTPPGAPSSLTAVGDYRQIILGWSNPSSVDLDHIQIYASKTNDVTKATLLAKSTTTNFTHSGLEDSVTWYYWIRSANKRGMTSDWSSKLGTSAMTRDVLSFLQNKITESELAKDLLADIDSKAVAAEVDASIEDAKSEATAQVEAAKKEASSALSATQATLNNAINQEATDRNNAVADEAKQRSQAISAEADARTKAISDEAIARADAITKESDTRTRAMADEVTARNKAVADEAAARTKAVSDEAVARAKAVSDEVAARTKAVADEATARAKAISDEAAARATAISDSVAVEATARAKAIADSASSLSDKIEKEVTDRVKAVSDLDTKTANAISSESSSRIAAISDEAKTRADAILQEKNSRQAEIKNVSAQMQTANESLAQQISQVAAGTGEQFDSLNIWYFDTNNEGWTEDDGSSVPMNVTSDGWLKSANSTSSCRSPNNMAIDANAYRFIKLRIKKVGNPVWAGKLYWIGASEQGWSDSRSISFDEPEYDANGIATLSLHDIDWRSSTTIRRLRLDFLKGQNDANYLLIDWIAVGRPTPGAGMAALQDEKTARTNADAAEAASRSTLATQLRGSYDGTDITKLSSGLIFQEQQARVTADKVEATARQSLETKVNDSVSSINKSLDTLNTKDQAMASDITGLKSSLGDKADASAVQTLKATVEQQGSKISTQGQSITKLQGDLNTTNTNVGKKADQTAMTALQGTVTQQGKDIAAANSSISTLKSSLDTTNDAVAKKADATAVSDLSSRVSATEGSVSSQGDSIVQLNNSLSNALADSDASAKTPNNLIVNPSFERGMDGYIGVSSLSTVVAIQIPHVGTKALKIDPGSSVSPGQYIDFVKGRTYEIGVWVKQVSGTTDNGQGNNKLRVGNSAGAPVFEVPFVNLTVDWTKVSKRWKATETGSLPVTLSNYLTAGNRYFDDFYVIDVTDTVNIDASASAISSLQSTVTQQGKDISSQSTSIAGLNNSLNTTNENVAKKADSSAVQTLQNTVTQQGKDIASSASDISSLKNSLATTDSNVAKKADASALQTLQNTVTQQGKDLTSVGNRTTTLENSLKTTNDNVATKADASALSTLQNTVSQHGDSIASQSDSITSLKNSVGSLVNMGDNLVQDSSFDNGGQTFRTQQNSGTSGSIVAFGAFGENSAGVRMVRVNSTSPGLFANGKLPVPVNGARKYRYIVRAKGVSGAMNMLLRRWNFNGNTEGAYEDKNNTLTTDWQTITWDTSFSPKDGVDGQSFGIYCHPNNGEIWIDSFQVFDITDATNNETTASALSNLSTTVSRQGETVTSQGTAITKLQNDLSSTKTDLAKKADASALQTLQSTVTDQGKTLTSQGDSITALNNTVNTVKGDVAKKADSSALQNLQSTVTQQGKDISTNASNITALTGNLATTNAAVATKADASALSNLTTRVTQNEKNISSQSDAVTKLSNTVSNIAVGSANLIPNSGTMEGWSDVISDTYRGNKVFSFTRKANSSSYVQSNEIVLAGPVDSDSYVYSFWAKAAKDGTVINAYFYNPSNTTGSETSQGVKGSSSDGSAAITLTTSWARYWVKWTHSPTTGTKRFIPARLNNSSTADQTVFISSPQLETGNVVTDWKAADSDFASASALSTLTSRVTSDEGVISSQGSAIADLKNSLATTNSTVATKADASALSSLQNTVTKQGTDLKSASDSITTLKNSIAATDANVAKKADASALQTLQSTVSTQGDKIASQGNSITSLGNSLDTVKGDVAKKADTTALNNLSTRVSNAEDKISSSSDAITSLNSSLSQQSKRGANILPDGTFESYSSGYNVTNGRVIVTADDSHGGNKCIRVTRPNDYNANATDNSDNHIFSGFQVRDNAVFYVECWVKLDAKSTTMDGSVQIAVGMSLQYQDNSWQWPALIKSAKDLSADTWTKVSGYLKSSKSGIKQAMVRISIPNVSTVKAGNSFLVDDFVITDVTDAYNAQQTADATASAVSTLQTTVSRQGDSITSQGDSITTLNNGLATANKAIGTKADASALSSLQNTVTQQGEDVAANTNNITALSNQVVNGKQDTWARRIYKCQLANAGTEPTFSDIQGLSPVFMDEVADAAKMDFSGAGSYVVAHYKAMVRVAADTTITMAPGSRVFDDTGAVYVNGVRVAFGNAGWNTVSFDLKAGWNTVEFLVNQWTGNAYVNLGFKLGDKVAELYSGLGVSSLSSALNSISSNVSKVGDQVSSNSTAITSLKNGLSDTNSTVAKKADATALQTLQNTVTQQGKDIASQSDSVTNLSNALNNVSIGGVNLVKNSGDMTGWSGKTNEIFRGNAVISATSKAGGSYRDLKEIILDAPVDNAEYVYSFFAKGGENGQSMTAYFYNPNSTISSVSSQGVSGGDVDGRMSFTLTTEWVRYWVKWKQKPGTGSKKLILARIQASSTKDQTVSITSPKLEVGNMPTEWSPAPSDMASSNDLSSLKTTVDANSGAIQSVTSRVQKTEDSISTQNTAITKLQGDLSTTNNLVSTKADSTALQTLSGRVDKTESSISTQNDAITKLNSSLDTTNKAVSKKAEQSSLDTLSGRVSSTENGITAANSSITSLNAAIRAENASSGDLITNPTFDPQYAQMGFTVVTTDTDGVPANCPFRYAAKLAARDHHPNFNTIVATLGDVFEISALVACGAGNADFNLYIGTANGPTGGVGGPLYNGGNTKATSTWTRVTWKFTVSQAMVDKGYIRPFLQINQSSPFGTIWYVTDWHMRNITAASKAQDTANATSKAVDSLTSTVNQQGSDISSIGSRTTSLENGLSTTNANVAKKADSSALQTLQNSVTQQGNDISGQGSRVTSLENNLTAGANLIPNPAMLNGAQGWAGSATTVDGYAAVVSSSGWSPSSSYFQVTPGDIIDLSLMSQSEGAASISWGLRFDGPGLSNFCLYAPALTFAAGEKKSVSAAITVPAGATKAMFQASARATSARTVYNIIATRRDAGTKANSSAIDTLNSTVKTQGDTLSSIGSRTTSLENGLNSANSALSLKADASALSSLTNTVTQQGKDLDAAEANITAANTSITSMQASLTRRTVFTVTAKGNGNSANHGFFDESGKNLFTPGRSYALITFKANSDGSTVINTSKTYDVFGSANNGKAMSDDIAALANGVYVCVMTYDEPSGQRNSIASALELLGGTTEVINSLPYRGAYILLGRKGMKAGDGLELRAPTGGDSSAFISTSVEFVNGVMMGLGAAGGVMMKADANASAITTLQNTVKQQGDTIASSSSAITSLQNDMRTVNDNVSKKADASALQTLQNTVTQQGKDISTQSASLTQLNNSLSATNASIDASGKIPGNLIVNSSFEREKDGYTGWSSIASVIAASVPHSGSKILKLAAGGSVGVGQDVTYLKGRTYKIGAWAKQDSGTVIQAADNTKFRIADSTGLLASKVYGPFTSDWQEISFTWKPAKDTVAATQITTYLSAGAMYFDDFYVIDITDRVDLDATVSAVSGLTTRLSNAEGNISSQSDSITTLNNGLSTLNKTVSTKADATALSSLQNTVTQQGKDISSASGSITSLQSSLNTIKVQSNPWIDGTFETYDNNQQLGGSTAIVTTDFKNSGNKCLKVTRPANTSGNSDKTIGSYSAVRQSAKYRVEFWAMMPASESPPSGWTVVVGLHSINKDGGNDWQGIVFDEAGLGGRDQWVKFTGVVKVSPSVTRSHVWISTRGQSGSNTPGYAVYIDDFVITDITDAADAQATADANATAISSLQTKVSDIDGKVTAQTSQLSSMQSKVDASSSKVDQLSKTISDSQSTQASLNTSLQSQIDAQASANIKNQADLNSAATSIATIKSTQSTQATQLSAIAKQQTDMTASLDNQSASIQTLQEAVSNNDALNSTWMVKMQTNNNGQKYAAGIALGVDGKNMQSQFLVQADRFALINTSNGNTTTPFVIDNGVTYMNAAYIKDGAITNAKIGGEIRSDNFVDGSQGWRIGKDGSSQFNNVVVRGRVEANSGSFRGDVYANNGHFRGTLEATSIIGDVAVQKSFDSYWDNNASDQTKTYYYRGTGYPMTLVCQFNCYGKPNGGSVGVIKVTVTIDGNSKVYTFESNGVASNE